MEDIPVAQSWSALPPVVYESPNAGTAVSTRKLEKDYRDAIRRVKELEAALKEIVDDWEFTRKLPTNLIGHQDRSKAYYDTAKAAL